MGRSAYSQWYMCPHCRQVVTQPGQFEQHMLKKHHLVVDADNYTMGKVVASTTDWAKVRQDLAERFKRKRRGSRS